MKLQEFYLLDSHNGFSRLPNDTNTGNITIVQGDVNSRYIFFNLSVYGKYDKLVLSNTDQISLYVTKPDGNCIYVNGKIHKYNNPVVVEFPITYQMSTVPGNITCELIVHDENKDEVNGPKSKYTFKSFIIECVASNYSAETLESTSEYPVLIDAIAKYTGAIDMNKTYSDLNTNDKTIIGGINEVRSNIHNIPINNNYPMLNTLNKTIIGSLNEIKDTADLVHDSDIMKTSKEYTSLTTFKNKRILGALAELKEDIRTANIQSGAPIKFTPRFVQTDAVVSKDEVYYTKVGGLITYTGQFNLTPPLSATSTNIDMNIPTTLAPSIYLGNLFNGVSVLDINSNVWYHNVEVDLSSSGHAYTPRLNLNINLAQLKGKPLRVYFSFSYPTKEVQ